MMKVELILLESYTPTVQEYKGPVGMQQLLLQSRTIGGNVFGKPVWEEHLKKDIKWQAILKLDQSVTCKKQAPSLSLVYIWRWYTHSYPAGRGPSIFLDQSLPILSKKSEGLLLPR